MPVLQLAEVTRAESLALVASVPFGRVVFTARALPAVRLVAHLVDGGQIIIRASLGLAFGSAAGGPGVVVAYEADLIDEAGQASWTVAVVGRATRVGTGPRAARCRAALRSWLDEDADEVIAISADLVTGYRMIAGPAAERTPGTTGVAARIPGFGSRAAAAARASPGSG
jgi:hypothetical protein